MPDPDPCIEATRLRAIRTAIATGDTVKLASFGQDRTEWYQANLSLLDKEIERADAACAVQEGRATRRTRFAISGRARPY